MKYLLFLLPIFFVACSSSPDATNTEASVTIDTSFENLSPTDFRAKIVEDKDVVILDVRTPAEIIEGKVVNAVEMDINDPTFTDKMNALDKNKTYLVYCKSGGRSAKACGMMKGAGIENVYNLEGGMSAYVGGQ